MIPTIIADEADVVALDVAIASACISKSDKRLEHQLPPININSFSVPDYFRSSDGLLVVSFDAGWYPFLDNTRGYNQSDQRWYMPKTSRLLAKVALEMQKPLQKRLSKQPGGRVFLGTTGVVRWPHGHGQVEVLRWTLQNESYFL